MILLKNKKLMSHTGSDGASKTFSHTSRVYANVKGFLLEDQALIFRGHFLLSFITECWHNVNLQNY